MSSPIEVSVVGNSFRRIAAVSHDICGLSMSDAPGNSIQKLTGSLTYRPDIGSNVSENCGTTTTVSCLSVPGDSRKLVTESHREWIQKSQVVFLIYEFFDVTESLFEKLIYFIEMMKSTENLCVLFSRDIQTVDLRNLLIATHQKFPEFHYVTGVTWGSKSANIIKTIVEKAPNHEWDQIPYLKHATLTSRGIPAGPFSSNVNSSVPVQPLIIDSPGMFDTPGVSENHRERAIAFLLKTMDIAKSAIEVESEYYAKLITAGDMEKEARKIELGILECADGYLQEYVSTLCHYRILLQMKGRDSLIGKRKREIDEILLQDNHKRSFLKNPIYHWCLILPPKEGVDGEEVIDGIYLGDELNAEVETRFRTGQELICNVVMPGFNEDSPLDIDLVQKQILSKQQQIAGIHRYVYYMDDEVILPAHWKTHQEGMLETFQLKTDDKMFQKLQDEVEKDIKGAKVNFIVQIQNLELLRNFQTEQVRIAVNNQQEPKEAYLYCGTGSIRPKTIIDSVGGIPCNSPDPDPNFNWGTGIHLSREPWYADERAFRVPGDTRRKQIFVVHTALGESVEIPFNPSLRRPPERVKVNSMPIFYDSVVGKYTNQDSRAANVSVVYSSTQALPAFLIDYTVPQ